MAPTTTASGTGRQRRTRPALSAWVRSEVAATVCLLLAGLLFRGGPVIAQMTDGAVISTEGTQFIVEPKRREPPPRPQPEKPQAVAPAKPEPEETAAPVPAKKPPRYPAVIILLDASDSMLNKVRGSGRTRLDEAKSALQKVVQGMSAETRVQLWIFNTRMRPVNIGNRRPGQFVSMGEHNVREQMIDKLNRVTTSGGTNLFHSITRSLQFFADPKDQALYRSGQRFPVLVVISDGEDSGLTRESMQTVQKAKEELPLVTINTIGFNIGESAGWFKQLCRIATHPEGCATAENREQLRDILESFYRPRNP